MGRARKDMHQLQELVRLHRMGLGARAVARTLGIRPTTEHKYREMLKEAGLLAGDPDDLPERAELRAALARPEPEQ